MNRAYVAALAAVADTIISGLTSFGTVWSPRRRSFETHREAKRAKLEAL
jgi:hypothetical protein